MAFFVVIDVCFFDQAIHQTERKSAHSDRFREFRRSLSPVDRRPLLTTISAMIMVPRGDLVPPHMSECEAYMRYIYILHASIELAFDLSGRGKK